MIFLVKNAAKINIREQEINNLPDIATLFFFLRNLKNRCIAIATELFFMFFKKEKNKLDWVGYFFPTP